MTKLHKQLEIYKPYILVMPRQNTRLKVAFLGEVSQEYCNSGSPILYFCDSNSIWSLNLGSNNFSFDGETISPADRMNVGWLRSLDLRDSKVRESNSHLIKLLKSIGLMEALTA